MAISKATPKTPAAVWSTRLALFSILLVLAALILHRFAGLPTWLMLNIVQVGFAGAGLAIILGIIAIAIIWRRGVAGAVAAVAGILYALALFSWPLAVLPTMMSLPWINDITTDIGNPPQFRALAYRRAPGANSAAYPGPKYAAAQAEAYPYLKSLEIDRSRDEAFDLAHTAVRRLKWTVVALEPPQAGRLALGRIEAYDRTLVLGFYDDVVIRIWGSDSAARIDIRSASRYGRHDFGRNAARLRQFIKVYRARMEETVSIAAERAAERSRGKARKSRPRRGRDRSRRRRRR